MRIERAHRTDDPIIDLFDTYALKKLTHWRPIILYGAREYFGTIKQDLNGNSTHFDWTPLYEPLKR